MRCDCLFSALRDHASIYLSIKPFKEIHGLSRFMLKKGEGGERGKGIKGADTVKIITSLKKEATCEGSTRSVYVYSIPLG